MFKKTIRYSDLDGNPREEDFYFHLSKPDLVRMKLSEGGLETKLRAIVASGNGNDIIAEFEKIVKSAFGKRSEDNRRFMKSEEIWNEFRECPAYDEFFMELVTSAEAGAEFIRGVMPVDTDVPYTTSIIPSGDTDIPAWIREHRDPTKHEIASMSKAQLVEAMRQKNEVKAMPAWQREDRRPTVEEVLEMNSDELEYFKSVFYKD